MGWKGGAEDDGTEDESFWAERERENKIICIKIVYTMYIIMSSIIYIHTDNFLAKYSAGNISL